MFLVGEIGISAVGEHSIKDEVSKVTHSSIDALVVRGLVRDDERGVNVRECGLQM